MWFSLHLQGKSARHSHLQGFLSQQGEPGCQCGERICVPQSAICVINLPCAKGIAPPGRARQASGSGSKAVTPYASSAADAAVMTYFCESPEIPDKASAAAASPYLTAKTLNSSRVAAGTAHWTASKPSKSSSQSCSSED